MATPFTTSTNADGTTSYHYTANGVPTTSSVPPRDIGSGDGQATSNPGNGDPISSTQQAAIQDTAKLAYQYAQMNMIGLPGLQLDKDKAALQAAEQAAIMAAQDKRLQLVDLPMVGLHRDELLQQIAQQNAQLTLNKQLGFGQLGLQGYQASNQTDLARQQLAQQGYIEGQRLAQQNQQVGLQGAQLAQASEMGRAGMALQAANQIGQQGLQATALMAQLNANPRNAFQAQSAMRGLDQRGLSNSVGAISGQATPSGQQMQGTPQNGSLGSAYGDMRAAGQGQIGGVQGAGGQRFTAPNPLNVQNRLAEQYGNTTTGVGYDAGRQASNTFGGNVGMGTQPILDQAKQQQNWSANDPMKAQAAWYNQQAQTGMNIQGSPTPNQVYADTTGYWSQPGMGGAASGYAGYGTGGSDYGQVGAYGGPFVGSSGPSGGTAQYSPGSPIGQYAGAMMNAATGSSLGQQINQTVDRVFRAKGHTVGIDDPDLRNAMSGLGLNDQQINALGQFGTNMAKSTHMGASDAQVDTWLAQQGIRNSGGQQGLAYNDAASGNPYSKSFTAPSASQAGAMNRTASAIGSGGAVTTGADDFGPGKKAQQQAA